MAAPALTKLLRTAVLPAGTLLHRGVNTAYPNQAQFVPGVGDTRFAPIDNTAHGYVAATAFAALLESAFHDATPQDPRIYQWQIDAWLEGCVSLTADLRLIDLGDEAPELLTELRAAVAVIWSPPAPADILSAADSGLGPLDGMATAISGHGVAAVFSAATMTWPATSSALQRRDSSGRATAFSKDCNLPWAPRGCTSPLRPAWSARDAIRANRGEARMITNKVAMVTGATRGIGRCAAIDLARRGHDVVVTGRTLHEGDAREEGVVIPGSLERTAEEVRQLGRQCLPLAMDIMDRSSIEAGVRAVMEEWGRVDVLVNNAPYSGPGTDAKFLEIDPNVALAVVEADYANQIRLTQLVVPGMLERGSGTVVNLGSGSALVPPPAAAGEGGWSLVHCAAKAAFHQVAVILDVEFRSQGIRAFTLEPGYTVTERAVALRRDQDFTAHFRGDPPEVAGAVIGWLAESPDADAFLGGMVHAQAVCKRHALLPGWPPDR